MSRCVYCGQTLPGEEQLCQACLERRNAELERGTHTFKGAIREAIRERPATSLLIAANVLVFMLIVPLWDPDATKEEYIAWGANHGLRVFEGEWWRLASSMFLHGGVVHLIFNMQGLNFLGSLAEAHFGSLRFLVAYLLAGIAASVTSISFHPMVPSVGASGAIFGVAGMLMTGLLTRAFKIEHPEMKKPLISLATFAGYNLIIGLLPGIDNAAHAGGLAAGLLLGLWLALRIKLLRRERALSFAANPPPG